MDALPELLKHQIANYRSILALEKELTGLIGTDQVDTLTTNTQQKQLLTQQTIDLDSRIEPLLAELRQEDGTVSDPEVEGLRQEALALLDELLTLQQSNQQTFEESRQNMLAGFKQAKQAKQMARGYKQSREIYRTSVDTKS